MSALADKLKELGFTDDAAGKQSAEQNAEAQGLHHNGDYSVLDYLVKGDCIVLVEQNNAAEDLGGYTATVNHPPLAIVSSPKGRVAFNPEDTELAAALVADLA